MVVADFMHEPSITPESLLSIGYEYDAGTDKWNIGDAAADYIYTGNKILDFDLPGTCKIICNYETWKTLDENRTIAGEEKYFPLFFRDQLGKASSWSPTMNFLSLNSNQAISDELFSLLGKVPGLVLGIFSNNENPVLDTRRLMIELMNRNLDIPVILAIEC